MHNEYGKFSGEEAVVQGQKTLLEQHGHDVHLFTRSSAEISSMAFGKLRAFFGGIYNPFTRRAFCKFMQIYRPDLVHIHNLFPLISPSILLECNKLNIPVVMTVHNYRLMCPNGLFTVNSEVCDRCADGREYWCFLRNCEQNYLKSLGYALRNYISRRFDFFKNNIAAYAVLSNFQQNKMLGAGFPADKVLVVPNMTDNVNITKNNNIGKYVSYVGRISHEKGISTLFKAASNCPDIPFYLAGNYEASSSSLKDIPDNCHLVGFLEQQKLHEFHMSSRFLVSPSICYETFGLSNVDAMLRLKPVIASRIGGLPEIVEDGITGILFEPGNEADLTEKIRYLWDRPELCSQMGRAGREKALKEYSSAQYYERLMAVYDKALNRCRK